MTNLGKLKINDVPNILSHITLDITSPILHCYSYSGVLEIVVIHDLTLYIQATISDFNCHPLPIIFLHIFEMFDIVWVEFLSLR